MSKLIEAVRRALNVKISRSKFIKLALTAAALLPFYKYVPLQASAKTTGFNGRAKKSIITDYDLVYAKGDDPYKLTYSVIEKIGGIAKFVKKGDTVVVKPNIGWDKSPEQAANTNPQVVAALVEMCYSAGAKTVKVFDVTCNDERRCYSSSGIEKAAKAKGAKVSYANDWDVVEASFGFESSMQGWPILREAVECDCFINVPVLKHHGLSRLTLSMKNLMGVCGGSRGKMHWGIGQKIIDLTKFINPDLTVIDAYRVLLRNGPTGGNLADVELKKTVFAATDPSLADIYACSLVDVDPNELPNLKLALEQNYGITDIKKAKIAQAWPI